MMNPLLKRQIEKYLGPQESAGLEKFLSVINDSYNNYEDQVHMLQRAIKLSSDELFEANHKLREEAKNLKEANKNLESILNAMKMDITAEDSQNITTAEYIRKQSAEIIEINSQREKLLKNLEKQNQELNEYSHMVSHDLKAPLRNINTLVTWIAQDYENELDGQAKKSFELIQFNLEKMDLLIKGILDYSSVDKPESENRLIDINILINEIVSTMPVPATFSITINDSMPSLYGNYFRYRQLFHNIIENAIKHNSKQNGIIEIGGTEKGDFVEFYIRDNGNGIPEAYFNKIFNIFTKLDNNSHSSGIGLSIVKKIINFYGGAIWLESTPDIGTTFYFKLPKNGKAQS